MFCFTARLLLSALMAEGDNQPKPSLLFLTHTHTLVCQQIKQHHTQPFNRYAGIPSLEAEAWFGGANVAGPKKVSLNPSSGGVVSAGGAMAASRPAILSSGGAGASVGSPVSPSNSGSGGSSAADTARIAELEAALKRSEARVSQLEGENKSLTAAVSAAVSSSSSSGSGSGSGGADAEEVEALKARVAELEASESKLKKAVAALSA